tara:strand:+ start:272 stop:1156 length:885 start_codon:yes stop_codon:yes gene_type:complete
MVRVSKYIVKLFIYSIAILLSLFIIKYSVFYVLKGYYFKNLIPKKIENVDVGIFGNSKSQMGINENYLNKNSSLNFENFSILGLPLYYNCSLIQNVIDQNKMIKIVLELGAINIDEKGSMKHIFSEESFKYFSQSFYYILNDKSTVFLNQNLIDYLIFGSLKSPFMYFLGTKSTASNMDLAYENYSKIKEQVDLKWKNPFDENLEIVRLNLLIKENPKIDFLIIRIPEHKKNLTIYNNEKRYRNVIKSLSINKNVTIKDYRSFKLNDSGFRDFNHLSTEGRDLFTEFFLKENFQ